MIAYGAAIGRLGRGRAKNRPRARQRPRPRVLLPTGLFGAGERARGPISLFLTSVVLKKSRLEQRSNGDLRACTWLCALVDRFWC